jgi:hypothetical protein
MKNSEIKYNNLSTDYHTLYDEIRKGNKFIGFQSIRIDNKKSDYSKLCEISYDEKYKQYHIGDTTYFDDYSRNSIDDFIQLCEIEDIRYFKYEYEENN